MNEYRQTILDWVSREDWTGWYAATLTHRELPTCLKDKHGEVIYDRVTLPAAQQNLRHFLNVTSVRWNGRSALRYASKRCEVIPTFEYGRGKHYLHYHLAIKKPDHVPHWKFVLRLKSDWFKTTWGSVDAVVTTDINDGWLRYITKDTQGNKSNPAYNFENVDFTNISFAG
jgi:hypothetical protein